jgi:ribose transport system ATP-binding protein
MEPVSTPRLELAGVTKSFGPTKALDGIDLKVMPGESLALIGENGAGKSTLMKVISGAHQPDSGNMFLDGRPFRPQHPVDARRAGVAMIYQELNLVPDLNAVENITLGSEPCSGGGWIQRRRRLELARNALGRLDYQALPLDVPVGALTIGQKQVIEIARALLHDPRVLILDEPTSSLTRHDTEKLFKALNSLKKSGVSIIYISHFLEECQEICDTCSILRDGQTVTSGRMEDFTLREITTSMVGRDIEDIYPHPPDSIGEPVLEVRSLAGQTKPREATFTLHRGEILGIAGLIGAGRTETLRTLFGMDLTSTGEVHAHGRNITGATPSQCLGAGIGMLSENRKEEGLLLNRSLADNLTMTLFDPVSTAGVISPSRQAGATRTWMDKLKVKARHPWQAISELSGGNQQKIAIGRILYHGSDILLLDEPTRGIDVGSKAQIYQLMVELAMAGKSIVFVSSYLPELLGVCHNIAVMNRGVLCETRPASEWSEHELISAAIQAESANE